MTMLELLVKVSDKVEVCWKKDENGIYLVKCSERYAQRYAAEIIKLMSEAAFDDGMRHTGKDIASRIEISTPTFSKFIHQDTNINQKNLEKILKPILTRLSTEGNLADDEMRKRVGELLFRIFRKEDVKGITMHFQPENNEDDLAQRRAQQWIVWNFCQEQELEKIFGNLVQTQDIHYGDYVIDDRIMEDEIEYNIGSGILFIEYRQEDDSKRHVVVFDVKNIDRERLHQRIRCLQRKDNVFAVLMVAKGECHDDIDFYRDEHSNIMLIEYKEVREGNSENCSYNYLRGMCLSWYDEKCKALMTEGIDKIIGSHK